MKVDCQFILMDVEGTTTELSFVRSVLFPYSQKNIGVFLRSYELEYGRWEEQGENKEDEVALNLWKVAETLRVEEGGPYPPPRETLCMVLDRWIKQDRKHPALKEFQGMIWRQGYQQGDFKGHVYSDVPPTLDHWTKEGRKLGIYSSGSVEAQKLLFRHSIHGDLTPYLSHHFDTQVGHKMEISSYQNILSQLDLTGEKVLFLTDVEQECDAAKEAGMRVLQVVRPGTIPSQRHQWVSDFYQLTDFS